MDNGTIINMYNEQIKLSTAVSELLIKNNLTISVSESCTGGLLSAALINYPGISKVFAEGCVTYSNGAKIRRLGVRAETLDKCGAVSFETAKEMACGIAESAETDIGMSTTGIAGPDGGSQEKSVGLVYIGLCIDGKTESREFIFSGDRNEIRHKAVIEALSWLRKELE